MDFLEEQKQQIRMHIWNMLDATGSVVDSSCVGKIPNFKGSEEASQRLASLTQWEASNVIKSNPDKAQRPVRDLALADGKTVYMAVPKMANIEPFYRLDDPARTTDADRATDSVPTVRIEEVEPIDIAICGSVAVNRTGARLGKGAGYADLELALLTEAGVVTTKTLIVTTVHAYQLIDDDIPEKGHDFRADIIVTPHETLYCPPWKRPTGLRWDDLDASKIAAIPILQARARERSSRLQKRPEGAGRRSDLG